MKKARTIKKLKLNKATVSNLDRMRMSQIFGGDGEVTLSNAVTGCSSETIACTEGRACASGGDLSGHTFCVSDYVCGS